MAEVKELRQASFRKAVSFSGSAHRSSAVFWCDSRDDFSTTISFLNYYKLKRDIDADLVATTRSMSGEVLRREPLSFDGRWVINYRPDVRGEGGSVEIEARSDKDFVIPYAAMLAIHESKYGISCVHAYGRTYSDDEAASSEVHVTGNEGSWTVRDSAQVRSFGIFHNGPVPQPAQTARLAVTNEAGEVRTASVPIAELAPHASYKMVPGDHISGLAEFLGGGVGTGALQFDVQRSFPRMLIGNEARDGSDFQANHSCFNFNTQPTDYLDPNDDRVGKFFPGPLDRDREFMVYPHSVPGRYRLTHGGRTIEHHNGKITRVDMAGGPRWVEVVREDGDMPTRFHMGMVVNNQAGRIPCECVFTAINKLEPRKRFHWGFCAADDRRRSRFIILDYEPLFGGVPEDVNATLQVYSSRNSDALEMKLSADLIRQLDKGMYFDDLFPQARAHLGGDFGYFKLFTDYGGLICYTQTENNTGSTCLEHSF